VKAKRLSKIVNQFLRRLGLIKVLHDDWEILGRSARFAVVLQQQKDHRSTSASATARRYAEQLRQFLPGLREDSPACILLLLRADLAALAGLLDNADKHILEREAPLARAEHVDSSGFELLRVIANPGFHAAVRDDVEPLAKQGHAPVLRFGLQKICGALRLVHANSSRWPCCRALNFCGRSFNE